MSALKICMYNVTIAIKIGGIESYYWEVSKELDELGYDVEMISGVGDSIRYKELKIKHFKFTPREKILDLGNRFRKLGERVSFFFNAKKYLDTKQYDIFLIRKPLDFFTCYFMKKKHKGIKTVFISGGEDFYGFDQFFAKYVDYMFCVSQDNAKKIERRYSTKVKVIPNGVDTKKFKPIQSKRDELRKKYDIMDKKVLISVGRVVGWKGFQLVIESLLHLEEFYYVLIGDGDYLQELKELAKKLGVEKRVLFLGAIQNKELPNYLNLADIFIQPSIGHEAFGITIVEAMACGLPVVASRNGGIVDIVVDGKVGYLFEIGNIEQMSSLVKESYSNKTELSLNALQHVKSNFTWKSSVKKLLTELNSTL